ncbi:meiosis-specific nuclear structural protein 1 [Contarinia nasturtii]|uniref:meiosis-specific nuclear structural protein 1 n=1 Tax=Contarinia nasturtii TaxID=265458 RepID=UPI0012D479C7|nr:meiosis-specific nuclear structural protein 1 [Contarinia nasturtii]
MFFDTFFKKKKIIIIMDEQDELSREAKYRLYCDQRMAQQIRENSQELRELETRIRAAYVNKSLKVQLAEREKKRLQEKLQIEQDVQQMKQKLNNDLQRERQKKQELQLKQEQHRRELLEQIADKQFKRKILYEEFLKEKIIIDEIMAQIQREEIEEIQEKLRKTECLRTDIVRLIEEQNEWKEQQKRIATEENEKIVKYIVEREEYAKRMKDIDRDKMLAKLEQQQQMCFELNEIERRKLEREEVLIELKCKEVHEKQLVLDRKQLEDRIRQQMKAKLELENQLKEIEMRRLHRKQNEDRFREDQLKRLAEQDRLELLTKERQRVKKQEHYRIVREMLTAREDARNAEIFDLIQEQNELFQNEKRRQEIFAIERKRIIQQHADDIIGYLPKELLQ